MLTKYGNYTEDSFAQYKKSLIDRVWCLIPLREEQCDTIESSIERLNRELHGLIDVLESDDAHLLSAIHLLEHAMHEENFEAYRADIFRCCDIISQLGGEVYVR